MFMYILCVCVYQSVFNVGVNTLYFHPVLLLQVLSEMGEMETGDLDVEIVRWIIFHSFFMSSLFWVSFYDHDALLILAMNEQLLIKCVAYVKVVLD